ncbi:substrate-binding domain-containing protein [Azohydromonas sediminis]|uniref:helix-turn-helix transcriptional regulator n=1 Tax=Azohydromonas sediminis TaxID=2259674 RepID=UPI000E65C728|nr:substrate-binding domain-containing protein [Azohydromonas sediminis]
MFQVRIEPRWEVERDGAPPLDTQALLALLQRVQQHESIAQAARALGLSYRHAWGLVRAGEAYLGGRLLQTHRGRGATPTRLAQALLWADQRVAARLAPTLQTLASELAGELTRLVEQDAAHAPPAVRIQASHGFAVAALLEQMAAEGRPVELGYRNSSDALASLARGDCDMAGFHVPLGRFEAAVVARCARWLDPARHVLIHLAVRNEGLFVAAGNPKRIVRLADLARDGVRFVNRQEGSGTRMLVDLMLADAGIAPARVHGYETSEFTHAAVAAHVASGMADVGIGVETAARRFGLDFVPLVRERYFFAAEADALARSPLREVLAILRSDAFRARVDALAGYDAADTGRVQTPAEAFARSWPKRRAAA